jgi:iron complex outermembrane receptor protein
MKKNFMLALMGGVVSFQVAVAQVKSDSVSVDLKGVDVTAQRNKLYSGLGRIVTVIEQKEIAQLSVQSIDQLLDYVAGVDIRQRGTNTTQADISVRGGSFDQVLVLLNGVNVTDPQTGHFNLDIPLALSDVKRVEVLQGSSARILGPNAFSGAINIVTESAEGKFIRSQHEFGSYHTFGQSVSAQTTNAGFNTFASVNHKSSDGHLTNTDFDLTNVFVNSVLRTEHAGKYSLQAAAQFKDFGLEDKGDRYPREVSGGEQQRAAIARALVHQPKILLADEPTGNLDAINADEIISLLLRINKFGTTVVLVTHNRDIVNRLNRRVITMDKGVIISDKEHGKYLL